LYGITKTEYLKKPGGLDKMLEPFILDIKKLESEGININVRGETKNFKGSLLFVILLQQHYWEVSKNLHLLIDCVVHA